MRPTATVTALAKFVFGTWCFGALFLSVGLPRTNAAPVPPQLFTPEPIPSGWRIAWTSEPNARYELQRWDGIDWTSAQTPAWTPVNRITATGPVTAFDELPASASRRFYRLVLLGPEHGPDLTPPQLSGFDAYLLGVTPLSRVRIEINAIDPSGVRDVEFSVDDRLLGAPTRAGDQWSIELPFAEVATASRIGVRATDTAGNANTAGRAPPRLDDTNRRFVPLDSNGRPRPDSSLPLALGSLPPLRFLPALGAPSPRQSLSLTLPAGAELVNDNGREVLRFNQAELRLGTDSSFRFDPAALLAPNPTSTSTPTLQANTTTANLTLTPIDGGIRVSSTTPLQLPTGPLSPAALEPLLGLPPGSGVPLRVFDRFTLRWHVGTLDDAGIRGGRFAVPGLPLPSLSGDYPDHLLPASGVNEIRLPYHGRFDWPSGGPEAPRFALSPSDPGWLTLRSDGSIGWHNRSEIQLPGGGRFRADIDLDEPVFRLAIFADSIQVPLLGNLAQLILPDDPAACLLPGLDPAMLSRATGCLHALGTAYDNVSASAVAASPIPENPNQGTLPVPPDDLDTSVSVLNAWAHRAVAAVGPALPLAPQKELLTHTGLSASAATDLLSAARHRNALARAALALHQGRLTGTTDDIAALDRALDEATTAALLRARSPDGVRSYAALMETLAALVETQSLLAEANRPPHPALHQAVAERLREFLAAQLDSLAIVPGQFTAPADSPIHTLNRFTAFQHLHEWLDTLAQAALLGADDALDVPIDEAITQIAVRLASLVNTALAEAEASAEVPGFLYALEDLLDLQASRQLSIFPARPELAVIPMPGSAAFIDIIDRFIALSLADLARPYPERTLEHEQTQIRRLTRILREVPSNVTLPAAPFERAHERVNARLADTVDRILLQSSPETLVASLELGLLNERLRRRLGLPVVANWEGHQLPTLVQRLADLARSANAWSPLRRARVLLLDESRALGQAADHTRRRLLLEHSLPLLTAARDVAVALWDAERSRREFSPLDAVDLLLPGDVRIDRLAGAAIAHRQAGWIAGAFRGRARWPKFDGYLDVRNASFDQNGTLDLALSGSASFRGVTLGISPRQPLTLSYRFPGPVRLHGEGFLSLPNGLGFATRLQYDEPFYGFRFEARDLRFDLAQDLTVLRPTLDTALLLSASDDLRRAIVDYHGSMNATFESLARQAGNLPELEAQAPGSPPDFVPPQITLPFSELNAWSSSVQLTVRQSLNRSHALTVSSLRQIFQTLHDDAVLAAETLETEARFLDLQQERVAIQRRTAEAFAQADALLLLGNEPDLEALRQTARETARAEAKLHLQHLLARPPQSLAESARHTTILLDLAAIAQLHDATLDDLDDDGLANDADNCPALWSSAPLPDTDNDGFGDACDPAPQDPAIPGQGPCTDALRLVGQPQPQAQALLTCQYQRELVDLGFDPTTGNLTQTNRLHPLPADEVEYRHRLFIQLLAQAQALGIAPGTLPDVQDDLLQRLIDLRQQELAQTPESNPLRRFELAIDIADLLGFRGPGITVDIEPTALQDPALAVVEVPDPALAALEKSLEERKKRRDERLHKRLDLALGLTSDPDLEPLRQSRRRGVVGDSLLLLQAAWNGLRPENAGFRTRIDNYIRFMVDDLRSRQADPGFLGQRLQEATSLARTLADFTAWSTSTLPSNDPILADLALTLSDFTLQLTIVAEARKAWWLLHQHAQTLDAALRQYGATMSPALRESYRQSFATTALASDRVLTALTSLAQSVGAESFEARLPGDLRVQRAFGGVLFNRDSGVWTGQFGGRLEFPDLQKAHFEINQATLATDGSFQIAASTGGPLPFGRLALTSSLQIQGSLAGLQSVSGTGQLAVPLATTTNLYAVSVGYDFDQRRFRFDTQADGLDWRLSDDFVLLNGGFGVEFSTAEPDGAVTFRGSAAMFARQSPLPSTLSRTNFHLWLTNAAVRIAADSESISLALTNGTLFLPEFFRTSLAETNRILTQFLASPPGQTSQLHTLALNAPPAPLSERGPAIALSPTQPLAVTYRYQPTSFTIGGALLFRDLAFKVPEFDALEFAILQARLVFPTNQPPYLTNLHAALEFPLPGQSNIVEVADAALSLAGLPTGTLRLRTNLDLYRADDWRLTLLGRESPLCPAGTGITLKPDPAFDHRLTLRFDAGMEFALPASILSDATGGALTAASCGSLAIPVDRPPVLALDGLGLSIGHARLGGPQGVGLTNVSLQLSGLTNLFSPSPTRPFLARLGGAVLVGPAGLGLSNAVFHFEGQPLPRFTVSELSLVQPNSFLGLAPDLPLHIDESRIRFLRDDLPLPTLLAATNLQLTVSGGVGLPTGSNPVLASRVRDLVVTFLPDGQPRFSVDGLGFTVDLTAILGDSLPLNLGGEVYLGGLNHAPNYLFAGKLRGHFKGNAVEGLVALDACGLRGVCFGLAGAEINVQLGYGFVLTGARGGVSFVNTSNDPCRFVDLLPLDPITGRPTGPSPCTFPEPPDCSPAFTLDDLRPANPTTLSPLAWTDETPLPLLAYQSPTLAGPPEPTPIPCPALGECPPASVNIQCMPHPDHGRSDSPYTHRVIYKFSSIDEPRLNALGITPQLVESLTPNFRIDPRGIALDLAHTLRGAIESITPRAPLDAPPAVLALDAQTSAALDQMELGFANFLYCGIQHLPPDSQELASRLYSAIREAAYAGVACQDLTLKLEGSVSYAGLASFANVSGGVVLSTTGSAGVIGAVNVLGIPVGQARAFVSSTDAQGNPILPSMCGELIAALGPLELGSLAYLNDCPDCTTALFQAFANLPSRLGQAYTYAIMQVAHPDLANPNLSPAQHLALLQAETQQMAFLAAMMRTPPRDPDGRITGAFLDFAVELADAVQPRWSMCGEVQPKLFGFPLSGGGRLYSYQFYAGPNVVDGRRQGYLLRDAYAFSPLQMFANYATAAFTAGLGGLFAPALDEAQAATSLLLPTLGQLTREGLTLPPPEFAARRTRDFLANATQTFSYRLAPFGMELGRAGGRILFPSLDHHPRGPAPRTPPALRNQGLPGELDVLLAALGHKDQSNAVNRLADIAWRGEGDADFAAIFAGTPFASAVNRRNLSLRDDYFPHGGLLGAGLLDFPALLASPLPPSLASALDTNQPVTSRLVALQDFIGNHLLRTVRVGELAFYLPAPNPPLDSFPTTPQALIESLRNFVPDNPLHLGSYYPAEKGFLQGWVDTPLLGLPTVRSRATWEPQAGLIRLAAEVPTNSWFNRYLGQALFAAELRGNSQQPDTLLSAFAPLSNQVARLTPNTPGLNATLAELSRDLPDRLARSLPKVSVALTANQVRIPVPTYQPTQPLTDAQTVARIANATLEAYSPQFRRPGAVGLTPLDRVRREGGVALRGDFNFLSGLVVVTNAEFTVSPNPNPLGLPLLSASLTGTGLRLFGLPFGTPPDGPSTPNPRSPQTRPTPAASRIEFHSDSTATRLDAIGSIPTLGFGSWLTLAPLSGDAIGATATFETTTAALPQGRLLLQPCQLSSPWLGTTFARIHGRSTNDPFTLSTAGPWNASATFPAGNSLDFTLGRERVLRLARSSATPEPFRASLRGNDLSAAELLFDNLNLGLVLQSYPDAPLLDPRRRSWTLAPGATVSLRLASDGTFDFRATIPQALPLGTTPFAALDAGFDLRLSQDGLSFAGTAGGGLWASLGGDPIRLTVNASASGLSFGGQASLPPLRFGVFRIDDGQGAGPGVSLSSTQLSFASGLSLRIDSPLLGNPALTLDPFAIRSDGSFEVTAQQSSTPGFQGILFGLATHHLSRSPAGLVTYTLTGETTARTLTGFGSIAPRSGSSLRGNVTVDSSGQGSLLFDAALLRLPQLGLTSDLLLHGAASTEAPFGFSTSGPWSAVATLTNLVADPPGNTLPEFIRLTPATAGSSLFTAAVTGIDGNLTGLAATRAGNVNLELFRNQPMAKALNNVGAGTLSLVVTNNPRRFSLLLDPPDLTYGTNVFAGGTLTSVGLFRLSSPSLRVQINGESVSDRFIRLESPALTLLPGTVLEQNLVTLPDLNLAANNFPVSFPNPLPTLTFPGLPSVRLHTTPLTLRADGFSSPLTQQSGTNYSGVLSFPATSSSLSLEFSGTRLRLRLPFGLPSSTALGASLPLTGGEATLDVTTAGQLTGTFAIPSNAPRNLGFNLLGFQPSGTLRLAGNATQATPNFALGGNFQLTLAYPNPASPTQTLTSQHNLPFDLRATDSFATTLDSGLPSFDLGWLRVQPGSDGHIAVSRNANTGSFALAFDDWDLRVFGVDFNNQDFTLSNNGTLSRNLPGSTFDLGSGAGLLRLVTGGVVPFDWVLNPSSANAGRTFVDLPATTSLSLPGVPNLAGTLKDGLAFGTALLDIPATGLFDRTWSRSLVLNGLDLGTVSARLRRTSANGPLQLTLERDDALWSGLDFDASFTSGTTSSFAASLEGTFALLGWNFGSASFDFLPNDPAAPFQGSATITDPSGNIGFTANILLRGGTKPCLEFRFNNLQRQICQP